jgi:hypothetical protein
MLQVPRLSACPLVADHVDAWWLCVLLSACLCFQNLPCTLFSIVYDCQHDAAAFAVLQLPCVTPVLTHLGVSRSGTCGCAHDSFGSSINTTRSIHRLRVYVLLAGKDSRACDILLLTHSGAMLQSKPLHAKQACRTPIRATCRKPSARMVRRSLGPLEERGAYTSSTQREQDPFHVATARLQTLLLDSR